MNDKLRKLVERANRAAEGASNDTEVGALGEALTEALNQLAVADQTLDKIARALNEEWSWEMVDDITIYVRQSGREVNT